MTTPSTKPAAIEPRPVRLVKSTSTHDDSRSLVSAFKRIDALEEELETLVTHYHAVVAHLANGNSPKDVPLDPPAKPEPAPSVATESAASALASLTAEQRAALRALLG
jgi:hypothetical protein